MGERLDAATVQGLETGPDIDAGWHQEGLAERAGEWRCRPIIQAKLVNQRGPWRSMEAVEYATLEWVDWFNNRRLLEPIGNIPPPEAEAVYYAQLEEFAIVVRLKLNSLWQTLRGSLLVTTVLEASG
jgi:hypothetical protein